MIKNTIDNLFTCVAFLLHTHTTNSTNMESLLTKTHIFDLSLINQNFITSNIHVIEETFMSHGNKILYTGEFIQIILEKNKTVSEIYDTFIKKINQLPCDKDAYKKSQSDFFSNQYSTGVYKFHPEVQFCNDSYTWSISHSKVCIPNKCSNNIHEQWNAIVPKEWKNSTLYAYRFREISVPLHELLHINQTSNNSYINEWDASYFSFSNLNSNDVTIDFAMKNLYRFLLFHESLIRNLYQTIPKNKIKTIFQWHNQKGSVDGMTKSQINILNDSIIKAKDAKLNTFAKNFAALEWYHDTSNVPGSLIRYVKG